MTPNPPTPTPVSQGDRETEIVLGHPATREWCAAVDSRHAATELELTAKDAEIVAIDAILKKYVEIEHRDSNTIATLTNELASLKQSILDLSHPNLRMLMKDRDRAVAELARAKVCISTLKETMSGSQLARAGDRLFEVQARAASEPKP